MYLIPQPTESPYHRSAMNNIFPPTPASSLPSPSTDGNPYKDQFEKITMYPQPGPTTPFVPPARDLPPTPPADDMDDMRHLSLVDAPVSQRDRPGRRPFSVVATPATDESVACTPSRKMTDPTPQTIGAASTSFHHTPSRQPLDVNLDAYATDFDDSRAPTLSFVTSSATESITGTPIVSSHKHDGEAASSSSSGEREPRIRTRSTAGRSTAYSSAESSGAYSYHVYENQVFHPHPPPLPTAPLTYNDRVGLGISSTTKCGEASTSGSTSEPFGHRPWQSDVVNRLRSTSNASTSSGVSVVSSQDYSSSLRHYNYHYNEALPWEIQQAQDNQPEAVVMVEEGREQTLDMDKLESMGGLAALTSEKILSLSGITHLLLSRCGTELVQILPSLLAVLAPTLVVLDISHNAFTVLPDELRQCLSLEELNVSTNPLRSLPPFIGGLFSLRQLQVDQCTLQALPVEMQNLASLHTLCVRGNRLVSLPAWLCQLEQLEILKVDDNPFAREWAPIVAPILARTESMSSPLPYIPPRTSSNSKREVRSVVSSASLASSIDSARSVKDFVTSPLAPVSGQSTPPVSATPSSSHLSPLDAIAEDAPQSAPLVAPRPYAEPRMQRMKSAGNIFDLGRNQSPTLRTNRAESDGAFMTPGSSSSKLAPGSAGSTTRSPLVSPTDPASTGTKNGKWGFLRKMSMNRLRSSDKTTTLSNSAASNIKLMPPPMSHTLSEPLHSFDRPVLRPAMSAFTLPSRNGSVVGVDEFGKSSSFASSVTLPLNGLPNSSNMFGGQDRNQAPSRGKRRSFLPIDSPPNINVSIPTTSPLMLAQFVPSAEPSEIGHSEASNRSTTIESSSPEDPKAEQRYTAALESIKSYLRDLFDLGRPEIEPYGGFEVVSNTGNETQPDSPLTMSSTGRTSSVSDIRRTAHSDAPRPSLGSDHVSDVPSSKAPSGGRSGSDKKFKDDKCKRAKILREIYETERTYVRGLGELVTIYVRPSAQPVAASGKQPLDTVVPPAERKIVFGGIESILSIHRDNLLPALERAIRDLIEHGDDDEGTKSKATTRAVGEVFRTYIAYMKQYSTYINNFDNAMSRMKTWTTPSGISTGLGSYKAHATGSSIATATIGASMSAVSLPVSETVPHTGSSLTTNQRKRVKAFLKRCRAHPMHSQINLESYLLLPIQRVPRYRLLLEDLAMCTPPTADEQHDTLDDALNEISSLASLMNEEKRESDSRLRLFHWQKRITLKGPSPLVQPHRKLILDGSLMLIRLVKKAATYVEVDNTVITDGEATIMPSKVVVPVEHIVPEPLDRDMVLILCSDMLILGQRRPEGGEDGPVDLFNVLRLSTVRAPASIVNGTILRVVDNRSIYYFQGVSDSEVLKWCRAINSARKR